VFEVLVLVLVDTTHQSVGLMSMFGPNLSVALI